MRNQQSTFRRALAVVAVTVAATGMPAVAMAATPTASTPTASTPTASTTAASADELTTLVTLVNEERAKAGCAAVTVNEKLTKAAQDHSQDMADHGTLSHTGSDGSSFTDRYERVGYSWSTGGENIAAGYTTPESVMAGWMASSGHKANILNCAFEEIGVGLAQSGNYWTQDFGTAR
ncbi:CAP domain-containing protein [Streptomyces spongiae]|uniref:CAP domain-containing protein n=1 Tax=Streptomyces spongiae TaxID=565072 RepID=A0A5N8XHY1_9ACTN|nr:CAP domain-containing protein [Streptomyces spongiae]MPY58588.1 CAP domain-containing protein [Streptomyces spongiae]